MQICGIVLAAGKSARFGSNKQLCLLHGQPLLGHAIEHANAIPIDELIITVSRDVDIILPLFPPSAKSCVISSGANQGIGNSISKAMECIDKNTTHTFFMLADQPLVSADKLRKLIDAAMLAPDMIIASRYNKIIGTPAIFPNAYFSELKRLSNDMGAQKIITTHLSNVIAIEMPEAAFDIDTVEDYLKVKTAMNRDS